MSAPFRTPVPVDLPEVARTLHLRRQLVAAVDHATALLPALGLPRLVEPDFVPLDTVAIGDALDAAIAALDALDGDADAEPWLGWTAAGAIGGSDDSERDTVDEELSLGWNETVSQLRLGEGTEDGDLTAVERHGRGFLRSGPDDAEDDDPAEDGDPAERDDDHGCESEPAPWRFDAASIEFVVRVAHV